jgi:hypothetical protein
LANEKEFQLSDQLVYKRELYYIRTPGAVWVEEESDKIEKEAVDSEKRKRKSISQESNEDDGKGKEDEKNVESSGNKDSDSSKADKGNKDGDSSKEDKGTKEDGHKEEDMSEYEKFWFYRELAILQKYHGGWECKDQDDEEEAEVPDYPSGACGIAGVNKDEEESDSNVTCYHCLTAGHHKSRCPDWLKMEAIYAVWDEARRSRKGKVDMEKLKAICGEDEEEEHDKAQSKECCHARDKRKQGRLPTVANRTKPRLGHDLIDEQALAGMFLHGDK